MLSLDEVPDRAVARPKRREIVYSSFALFVLFMVKAEFCLSG